MATTAAEGNAAVAVETRSAKAVFVPAWLPAGVRSAEMTGAAEAAARATRERPAFLVRASVYPTAN